MVKIAIQSHIAIEKSPQSVDYMSKKREYRTRSSAVSLALSGKKYINSWNLFVCLCRSFGV